MKCKICGNSFNNDLYNVKERMLGLNDAFAYFQCSNCNCLQIEKIPADMSRFYPSNYYSLIPNKLHNFSVKKFIRKSRNEFAVFQKGLIGSLIYKYYPKPALQVLSQIKIKTSDSILDIGSGAGDILNDLAEIGFNNLLGIDPYIKEDFEYKNGVKILKKNVYELEGKWDLIMLHHSFEHMADPLDTLIKISQLLSKTGVCLIRIPIADSFAWKHYRENWVQIDAPRHFYIHSINSVTLLANKTNLNIEKVVFDSTEFQFWGSEQYKREIPLIAEISYQQNSKKSIFSKKEIAEFRQRASELNKQNQGDTCAFFLRLKV